MRDYTKRCYKKRIYILCNTYAIVITLDFAQGTVICLRTLSEVLRLICLIVILCKVPHFPANDVKKEKNFFNIRSFVPNKRFSSQSEAVLPGLTGDLFPLLVHMVDNAPDLQQGVRVVRILQYLRK